jgi:hypothetical protein
MIDQTKLAQAIEQTRTRLMKERAMPTIRMTQTVFDVLEDIYAELEGRYDGAPDSMTKWMGQHLTAIEEVLKNAEVTP